MDWYIFNTNIFIKLLINPTTKFANLVMKDISVFDVLGRKDFNRKVAKTQKKSIYLYHLFLSKPIKEYNVAL